VKLDIALMMPGLDPAGLGFDARGVEVFSVCPDRPYPGLRRRLWPRY
jgi:hypothetical protein